MKISIKALLIVFLLAKWCAPGQAPGVISHQGDRAARGTNSANTGQLEPVVADAAGEMAFWSDADIGVGVAEPSGSAMALPVSGGVFPVNLGDSAVANMGQPIPASLLSNGGSAMFLCAHEGVGR